MEKITTNKRVIFIEAETAKEALEKMPPLDYLEKVISVSPTKDTNGEGK